MNIIELSQFSCQNNSTTVISAAVGLVIVNYITSTPFTKPQTLEMIRYLKSVECPDGGWGLHIEGPPTVFGTALNYVTLRLLGVPSTDEVLIRARSQLHSFGMFINMFQSP